MKEQLNYLPDIYVERLQQYSPQDARDLGLLMPYLSDSFNDAPVDEALLRDIISSKNHEQLVARTRGEHSQIIGAATLSIIMGVGAGKKGWLEDFVTNPNAGIRGVGNAVWIEMGQWCNEHDIDLHFTSRPSRQQAHDFYIKRGAAIRETTVFNKKFKD